MLLAAAAVLAGEHEPVYQLGASDANRITSKRLTELTALAVRQPLSRQGGARRGQAALAYPRAPRGHAGHVRAFEKWSAPMFKRIADGLIDVIDEKLPKLGCAPRRSVRRARTRRAAKVSTFTGQVNELVELFKPFTTDHDISFRCDNMRALWARVTPADQDKLLWAPHLVDWRKYWLDTHFPGLQRWTFDKLDEEFGAKPKSVYTYKELVEMFEATVKLHRNRPALRLLPKAEDGEPITYTYGRMGELAWQGAGVLRQMGVEAGERVILMSENRPEWGISYFAIILAGAAVVPLDKDLTLAEVHNLAKVSGAKALVLSRKVAERLAGEAGLAIPVGDGEDDFNVVWSPAHTALNEHMGKLTESRVMAFDELLTEPDVSVGAVRPEVKGDSLASLIFTSGTTGTPKGVMLTHKNFTSMVSKLARCSRSTSTTSCSRSCRCTTRSSSRRAS